MKRILITLALPLAVALVATFPLAQARGEFFIVSELPGQGFHLDSFVLPLSDPGDIAHARALIQQDPSARVLPDCVKNRRAPHPPAGPARRRSSRCGPAAARPSCPPAEPDS